MSGYNIIQAIEREAHRPGKEPLPYLLRIYLRSGRVVVCTPVKSDSYVLKVRMGNKLESYIAYDAIDQVTPQWL